MDITVSFVLYDIHILNSNKRFLFYLRLMLLSPKSLFFKERSNRKLDRGYYYFFPTGIAKYMRQMAKPTSVELTTIKEVKDYINYLDDLSVVGFFSGEDDPMYQLYVDTGEIYT